MPQRFTLRFYLLSAALCVAACAPISVYHREGMETARVSSDLLACEVDALNQVPVNQRQRFIPPEYTYRSFCYTNGHCVSRRVLIRPGYFETYDANVGLRADVKASCMTRKGFSRVSLPQCSRDVINNTVISGNTIQPALTETSCIIRLKSGGYQIVSP
ncbi:MAG: hypothetical protein AAFO72_09965 [Pseudomonadota bacterium]